MRGKGERREERGEKRNLSDHVTHLFERGTRAAGAGRSGEKLTNNGWNNALKRQFLLQKLFISEIIYYYLLVCLWQQRGSIHWQKHI
jgi:hypothetical protein